MGINFESVMERDIDLLIMRGFSRNDYPFIHLFSNHAGVVLTENCIVENVSHSVMTNDGETDVEVIISDGNDKIAFLIEDKIDAIAQPEQAQRYIIRAEKALKEGVFNRYYIFIVAPQKYLNNNQEAEKYAYKVSYEEIRDILTDEFELALIDRALDESKRGYVPVEDRKVTEFWNRLQDYVETRFPNTFNIPWRKGEVRGSNAVWITIKCGHGICIELKTDRGFVDLEIPRYADKFVEFSKANKDIIDQKRLYIRTATKSLAIRKYTEIIDFTKDFSDQIEKVENAFLKAQELQDLVKFLKF